MNESISATYFTEEEIGSTLLKRDTFSAEWEFSVGFRTKAV